jgi:probable phosphoglycerate mutase
LEDVAQRVNRVLARLRASTGDVLIFSHGHLLRILALRWAGIPEEWGARLSLASGSLSILGQDAASRDPVLDRWNDVCHQDA